MMTFDASTLATGDAPKPHGGGAVLIRDTRSDSSKAPAAAVILMHGRGASARDIMSLAPEIGIDEVVYLAPHAAGNSWYPRSFLSAIDDNQPGIDSAHGVIEALIARLGAIGVAADRVVLLGFSQGACLASDHAMRFPRRYGAIIALTGGVIGPEGTQFARAGDLLGTPVFLGANDPDPHVPASRVRETAGVLGAMGAKVEMKFYPGLPHSVCEDEIEVARGLIEAIVAG
jgi:predicted esterase